MMKKSPPGSFPHFSPPAVIWDAPSADGPADSMPVGNGDIGLNVWVEKSGDLVFTIGKTDSWEDNARLAKVGQVRVKLDPAPEMLVFRQTLSTATGGIVVHFQSGKDGIPGPMTTIRLWVDANHPVVHIEIQCPVAMRATALIELWRTAREALPSIEMSDVNFSHTAPGNQAQPTFVEQDTFLEPSDEGIGWYHFNTRSHGPRETLEHQDIAGIPGWTDPILHRIFGALIRAGSPHTRTASSITTGEATAHQFDIHVLTKHPSSPDDWRESVIAQARQIEAIPAAARRAAHEAWWRAFWNRSHIGITPSSACADPAAALEVAEAWALQRFITACGGRGEFPIKFNGSIFTMAWPEKPGGPDYRRWGPGYWWQNTRLPYAGALVAGDVDVLEPLLRLYAGAVRDVSLLRAERHFGYSDALYLPECVYFWGANFPESYGDPPAREREDKLQKSGWHKREWVAALEFAHLLFDIHAHTGDEAFLHGKVLPFALPALRFFDRYYGNGPDGRMRMEPAQALETFWEAVNPAELVAGLHVVTARVLALPHTVLKGEVRAWVTELSARLPELPVMETEGVRQLAPAEEFGLPKNSEVPELYAVWPFRLVSFEKPNAHLGLAALDRRQFRGAVDWRQDELFMATLGRGEEARDYLVYRVRQRGMDLLRGASYPMRFPAFWGPGYDWVPEQCHGGVIQAAAQSMLLQSEGDRIFLLPAWPTDWDVHFKLHAPQRTVVEVEVRDGRLVRLEVHPANRRADIEIPERYL